MRCNGYKGLLAQLEFTTVKSGWNDKTRNRSRNYAFLKALSHSQRCPASQRKTDSHAFDPRTIFHTSYHAPWEKKNEYFKARSDTLLAIQASCTRLWNVTSYQSISAAEVPACTFCECALSQTCAAARQDSSQVPLGSIWNIAASSSLQIPAYSTNSWKALPLLTAQVQWPRAASIISFSELSEYSHSSLKHSCTFFMCCVLLHLSVSSFWIYIWFPTRLGFPELQYCTKTVLYFSFGYVKQIETQQPLIQNMCLSSTVY